MNTRKTRGKRVKVDQDIYIPDLDEASIPSPLDPEDQEEARKSRIRDSNRIFARRMTILQSWSNYWTDYDTREGDAYPQHEARAIVKKNKKITCPIKDCGKAFTSIGGLKYHYARCNIQRCFKCKVCDPNTQFATRGELLRHMIMNHHQDLPSLNDEQKEIVSTYLSCVSRSDRNKKEKKINADSEPTIGCQKSLHSFLELQQKVYRQDAMDLRQYRNWQSSVKDWELVMLEIDRRRYYPPETESVYFKDKTDDAWMKVKTGESVSLLTDRQGSTISTVFFTGGINTACSWMPKNPYCEHSDVSPEIIAIAVNCSSLDVSLTYKESHSGENSIQFWALNNAKNCNSNSEPRSDCALSFMIGHNYGTVYDLCWCPLGTSWQPFFKDGDVYSRMGLLAIACGDGSIRILSIPHLSHLTARTVKRTYESKLEATPVFKVKPAAILAAPGIGPSTDYHATACKSISWNLENSQRFIVAGYANGYVALFDIANLSPILYCINDGRHIYRPLKSWVAHGAPVMSVAISSNSTDRILVASGSTDRQLKIWDPMDLNSCLITDRPPITKIIWDFRNRGVITATDTAFTSFHNRVSYKYPVVDGFHTATVSMHRASVWGLANSVVTNAVATSDSAGEVFVVPQLVSRSTHRRERNALSTHSMYTMLPRALDAELRDCSTTNESNLTNGTPKEKPISSGPEESNDFDLETDFTSVERQIANKPTKFLLPVEHRPIETFADFKSNFGIQLVRYEQLATKANSKLPESCSRAAEINDIYCDRPCDYPFSCINLVCWSPNLSTCSHLVSATQIGLCLLDKVQIVEQIYGPYVNTIPTFNDNNS